MPKLTMDRSLLEAALIGLGQKLSEVTAKIANIKRLLGSREEGAGTQARSKRRTMSASARARIAAAQWKRWAARRKQKATAVKPAPKKRRMSAEARKRIAEAARKRWAQIRAKKAKG